MTHFYGYKRDKTDSRDFVFKALQRVDQLPIEVDLRSYCSPVRDQGQLGSCTGFAITGLREMIEKRSGSTLKFKTLSPLFLYYKERELEGTINEDAGAEIRTGMKVLANIGVCQELYSKYNINKFTKVPTKTAIKYAPRFKTIVYSRVNNLNNIKSNLAIGQGVVLGFDVYESFESSEVAKTGIMPMPKDNEQLYGGHAVFVCGYNDNTQTITVKNSWGELWGDKGYFQMPYAYITDQHVGDMWTATK